MPLRNRWRKINTRAPFATPVAMARVGSFFYICAAAMTLLVTIFVPESHHRMAMALIAIAVAALATLVFIAPRLMPPSLREAMHYAAVAAIAAQILMVGAQGGDVLYWQFCYVLVDMTLFYTGWRIPVMLAWAAAGSWVAVFIGHALSGYAWFGSLLVASAITFSLGHLVRSTARAEWDATLSMRNNAAFERVLRDQCSMRPREAFSLGVVGVEISDDDQSDAIMQWVSQRIRDESELRAQWFRLRRDELAIIYNGANGAQEYLTRIGTRLSEGTHRVSIGICDHHSDLSPGELVVEASRARWHAARGGSATPAIPVRAGVVREKVESLQAAISRNLIVPHYQPLVNLATRQIIGAEALARWVDPDNQLDQQVATPDAFIPLAEESGLIHALGLTMLNSACGTASGWQQKLGRPIEIAVNVSALQLTEGDFIGLVTSCMERTALAPTNLTIEVTESTIVGDDDIAIGVLNRLRELGIRIAIDDFGTGYSSLHRLAHMPVDILKIDQSFLRELEHSATARKLLTSLIALGNNLDLT